MSSNRFLVLAIFWTLLTLFLSVSSAGTIQRLNVFDIWNIDKLAHFGMYFIFCLFWCLGLRDKKYNKIFAVIFSVSFGALMEIFQFYSFNGRSFEINDIIANSLGVIAGVLIFDHFFK
ncbi:MAG: VanZ family protein [Saprospiraceae bacterium]|nr:VanZ family protein [Saprospiraceae bacterium]